MGLIADIVESTKSALSSIGIGFRWDRAENVEDLAQLATSWLDHVEQFSEKHAIQAQLLGAANPALLGAMTATGITSPKAFAMELFEKWNGLLSEALGKLNVEIPSGPPGDAGPPEQVILNRMLEGQAESQERVSAAVAIINLVILSGSAISIAAEAASAGTVRSIAEAIQSWVWANGLGGFSSMMFSPQIDASLSPYLRQFYNRGAQAQIPPVTDAIRFQLREVFLTGRREELVGDEARPVFDELMKMHGFNKFHADSYWGAHWALPATGQLNEMLHRGVIDRDTWERFIRFNDVEPTTIPWLGQIIFNPYTRVDVRRMARLGILSEPEVLQAYADVGFFAPTVTDADGRIRAVPVENPDFTIHKAQALQVFTRVFNAIPELRQRFAKGWITADEVRAGLVATGIPADRAARLSETIIRDESPVRIAPEKELTRALITRAWKLRLISFTQAQFLIMRLGFDFNESELILRVVSEFDDPLSFIDTSLGVRLGAGGSPPIDDFEGI